MKPLAGAALLLVAAAALAQPPRRPVDCIEFSKLAHTVAVMRDVGARLDLVARELRRGGERLLPGATPEQLERWAQRIFRAGWSREDAQQIAFDACRTQFGDLGKGI